MVNEGSTRLIAALGCWKMLLPSDLRIKCGSGWGHHCNRKTSRPFRPWLASDPTPHTTHPTGKVTPVSKAWDPGKTLLPLHTGAFAVFLLPILVVSFSAAAEWLSLGLKYSTMQCCIRTGTRAQKCNQC